MSAAENGGGRDGSAEASVAAILAAATVTPIAQLGPDLTAGPDSTPRAVRGDVTIVWPYNSVNRSLAFLLAEPDVRLRRSKGQIRIQLHGASAAAVAESGFGGGDELLLSLQGASWSKDESSLKLPGSRVEWQLEFRGRIVLQAKVGETQEARAIDVDQPEEENGDTEILPGRDGTNGTSSFDQAPPPPSSPPLADLFRLPMSPRRPTLNNEEYASPAFIKRARISFGSLFEPGFDIFEEDGGVRGRGRKRTRFGRPSNAWRYSSQSVSPERVPEQATPPEDEDEREKEAVPTVDLASSPPIALEAATPTPAPRPQTTAVATEAAAVAAAPAPQTEPRPQPVHDDLRSSPPVPISHLEMPTPAFRLDRAQETATTAASVSTSVSASVFGSAPEAQMGGIPNPFATNQRPTSALFGSSAAPAAGSNPFGASSLSATTNPFGVPASAASASNPFGAPTFLENSNPFGAPSAVPFGTPGADAMGFVPDDGLFNDHVRFSFGDPVNVFEQQHQLSHAQDNSVAALPPTEEHFAESQYQYPEPPSQHTAPHASAFGHGDGDHNLHSSFGIPGTTAGELQHAVPSPHPEPSEPPRSTGQDHMLVWPISAPTLDAQHAEGTIPADAFPPSRPPATEVTASAVAPDDAGSSFITSGANEGVFEDDTTTDLPREVDTYGYNNRRYQNEQEEQMVGMVDEPPSRQSEEDNLESDGPEEAEPKDHLVEDEDDADADDADEDAEGDDDDDDVEHVEVIDDDVEHVEVIDEDGEVEVEEEEEASDENVDSEVEKTDQPGDDYDMRNYANIDDDIEGDDDPDEQSGAVTFNGEGEDDEEDEEEDEEEEYDEDADAEAEDDHYAAAPQHSFTASHGREADEEELESEEYDEEEDEEGERLEGEEEDYDDEEEDEEDDDNEEEGAHQPLGFQRPRMYLPPARPSQPAQPIVIDLLSDSDDDAPPPPRQQSKPPVSETPILPPTVPGFGQSSPAPRDPAAASSPPDEDDEESEDEEEDLEVDEDEIVEDDAEEEEEEGEEEDGDEPEEEEEEEEEEGEDDASVRSHGEAEAVAEPANKLEPEPKEEQTAANAESESEDEVEKELEAELEAELAADAKEAAGAEEADKVEKAEEGLPADAETVEAVIIEEATEAEAKPVEGEKEAATYTTEQPPAEELVQPTVEPPASSPAAERADGSDAIPKETAEQQADAEATIHESPESPAAVEAEPQTHEQPQPSRENERQDTDGEDVAMAEPDISVQEEDRPDQPPPEIVIGLPEGPGPAHKTRSQTAQLAQGVTAAASASETQFSPPPTQQVASQTGADVAAVGELPSLSATQTTEHADPSAARAHLPTPMQTQDGGDGSIDRHDHFQRGSFQYTEITSIAEDEDIDGQIQSQILSEMAMSFDFDQQPTDIDMRSVASGADVDMADHEEEETRNTNNDDDDHMIDEESAQTPRQIVHDHGDSMDVDAGTDIDMQSVVSEQPVVVVEEALEEVDIVVTEPAPEEEVSDAVVHPAAERGTASAEARAEEAEAATTLHKEANSDRKEEPAEGPLGQTKSSQEHEDQQHLQVDAGDAATAASTAAESRHKMSLRSTNSRLRRSLSPQPVLPSSTTTDATNKAAAAAAAMTAAVADATLPEEPDASIQIARSATTRRSKRALAAASQQTASQDEGADGPTPAETNTNADAASAPVSTPASKTRSAAALAAAVDSAKDDAGEDVSVLIARGATSKKRATPKAKEKEKETEKDKDRETVPSVSMAPPPPSMTEVKLALDRCRDTVPDCVPLRNLRPRLRTLLDVAVIATSSSDDDPPRRTRTRQYAMSLTATDPSLVEHVSASRHHLHNLHGPGGGSRKTSPSAAAVAVAAAAAANDNVSDAGSVSVSTSVAAGADIDAIIEVSLFRAHKDTLPTFRAGDGLLLRRFEVVALHDKGFGLRSTDESAYAVFPSRVVEGTDDNNNNGDNDTNNEEEGGNAGVSPSPPPQVNGPPVEDMGQEAQYIGLLKQWYRLLDEGARVQLAAANARFAAVDEATRAVGGESQ